MKRWRDGGFDQDGERARRAAETAGPLVVQAVAPQGRGRRFGLPLATAAAVLIILLAIASRYAAYFSQPTPTPAPPTAIAWIDVTARPTPLATPASTLNPEATPGEPTPAATPTPIPTRLPFVDASPAFRAFLFAPGDAIHFTVTLANASGADISLDPCPTYTMYLVGDTSPHPSWLLNCAAAGGVFEAGESLSFAMTFVVPSGTEPGENTLVWRMQTGFQAQASLMVRIGASILP
jgi:hypothetical protein